MKKFSVKLTIIFLFGLLSSTAVYADALNVIPVGKTVGIRVYTDGLLVIGSSDVNGVNAAKKCGIKVNDRIRSANGEEISSCEQFSDIVKSNPDGISLEIARDNQNLTINAVPVLSEDNIYRLGLWVRDSTAGIGTVTYYNPQTDSFAALGHAINDADTGNILSVKSGNILNCDILSVSKSKKGSPGEINGAFDGEKIGDITLNSQIGIFGSMSSGDFKNIGTPVPVAAKSQVETGDACIITDALSGRREEYSIKINKITNDCDKGLAIEITDPRIIEQSGGIVQGMSGSPIIQNGRLVGAVTHVFVNNPEKGYGALAENMIDAQLKN